MIWAVLLLVLGIGLAILEIFFASAGILAFFGGRRYYGSPGNGLLSKRLGGHSHPAGRAVGLPTAMVLAFKHLPETAMGRRLLLGAPKSEDVLPDDPEKEYLKGLIGRTGRAKSQMLLSGVVVIDGRGVDAVSESMPVEVGQTVGSCRYAATVWWSARWIRMRPPAPPSEPVERTYEDPFDLPPA